MRGPRMNHSYSVWVTGTRRGRLVPGTRICGVDPEGHHDVFAIEVKVAEVGEVACVGDGHGVACGGEGLDQMFGGVRGMAGDGGRCFGVVVEGVEGETVEDVGEAGAFGVRGSDGGVGAVAAGDAVAEGSDDSLSGEAGKCGGLVEVYGFGVGKRIGAEVDPGGDGGCWAVVWSSCGFLRLRWRIRPHPFAMRLREGGAPAGVSGIGEAFGLRVFADDVAGYADGGIDLAHGPAGEAVEALPVLSEDEFAHGVGELWGEEGGTVLAAFVDLGEDGFGEARFGGEMLHHLGEEDGVGRHGAGGRGVACAAAAAGERGGDSSGDGADEEPAGFGSGDADGRAHE